jgi:flavodoxin
MKTLIVYFSYDGNCDMIAQGIQKTLNGDLLRLYLEDGAHRTGLAKYLWGIGQIRNKTPALKPYTVDTEGYGLFVIGAPVWAGAPAPALNSFFEKTALSGKKVALFCCHAGGMGKALEKLGQKVSGNTLAGTIDFVNPAKREPHAAIAKAQAWAQTLLPPAQP